MLALSLPNGFASHSVPSFHPGAQSTTPLPSAPSPSGTILRVAPRSLPYSFIPRSFALGKISTYLLSCPCALFHKKHRGWGDGEMRMGLSFKGFKQRRIKSCRKRSSGQDDRPESRSPNEGSLLGISPQNVIVVAAHECPTNVHKCFVLRTYEKIACKLFRMNTYGTKDLKFPRMNTYRKAGG